MAEKKAMDSLMETFEEFKNKQNELEKKMAKGEDVSELKSNIEKLQNAMDAMEAKSQIPAFGAVDAKSYSEKEVKEFAAFNDFLRNGERNITPESEKTIKNMLMEYKDMSGGTPADGGNLVPQILASRIIDKVKEISPIRMYADVLTIGIGNELQTPRKTKAAAGGWIGESTARSKTDSPQFDLLKNPVMEMYANCAITQSLLEDQAFNLESYISNDIATTFAQLEGSAFVTGDGSLKPSGILQGAGTAAGFGVVKSGSATDFTLDNLIELEYSLSSKYIANAKWFMSRATIRKVRGFKDTTGQYLWQPSNIVGEPATFDGYPVIETPDMPVAGADALPVAFGDMRQGYQIVDKRGMTMLRDPYTNKPFVNFYATMRVGGKVANTEAVKLLQCKA
jgi:HK97 family phage major capsid protein